MTLVVDPFFCGSGVCAFLAEQWNRLSTPHHEIHHSVKLEVLSYPL